MRHLTSHEFRTAAAAAIDAGAVSAFVTVAGLFLFNVWRLL